MFRLWMEWLRLSWAWLVALCSPDRLLRDMRSMLYRNQPVRFSARKGLYVQPRRQWPSAWRKLAR